MSFLPHNGRLAANQINPQRTRLVQELRHNSPLLGCRFDPTGRYVFAGAQGILRGARVRPRATHRETRRLPLGCRRGTARPASA